MVRSVACESPFRTGLITIALVAVAADGPRSAPHVPTFAAADGGPAILLSNADGASPYSGVVRYQGRVTCTGVFLATIANEDDPGSAPAYVLTNGHCSDFPGANEVLPDRAAPARDRVVFNYFADTLRGQTMVAVKRIVYATMKGQDVAVLELDARYADLVDQGFAPWRPALTLPARDEPVVVVGAPLQQDPATAYLRLAACRLSGRAPVVLEFQWHWYEFHRHECRGIQAGSSGSPVISRRTGRLVGLVNTTTSGGRLPYSECTLDHPCEPDRESALSYEETSYATPLVRIDRCFDTDGRFDLRNAGCSLDAGEQILLTPNVLGAVNPALTAVPIGRPSRRWDVTVSGGFEFYRYKVATLPEQDCRDLREYGPALRVRDSPTISDALPTRDGWYFLCVVGGRRSRWGDQWQRVEDATVVSTRVDTVPPRVAPPLTVEETDTSWRVTFGRHEPEINFYLFKFGRPGDTRCDDPADYRVNLTAFITLLKSGRPYLFCAIPHDAAMNRGPVIEQLLP